MKQSALGIRLARRSDGSCTPVGEVAVGGEDNRVHVPPRSPLPRMPKALTLAWFLANGWEGSTVERRGIEVKLVHPSGAQMRLRATALGDVT
ncbi:hypothetical protein [Myxococcus stipitatus]|nr:hypothetical protein [Myxococcus stipitatus]